MSVHLDASSPCDAESPHHNLRPAALCSGAHTVGKENRVIPDGSSRARGSPGTRTEIGGSGQGSSGQGSAGQGSAEARPAVVAVFELQNSSELKKELVSELTEHLRVKLAEPGTVRVVDKSEQEQQLRKLVEEQRKDSYKTCYDDSCQVPLGRELAADKILRGKITKFGRAYLLNVELIDLASGASMAAASERNCTSGNEAPAGLVPAVS